MPNKTITQVPVTLTHLQRLNVEVVDGAPTAVITYRVFTDTGTPIGNAKSLVVPLTGPQTTTLTNFLSGTILPAVNSAEGT
jgi:hypothetical protein